MFSQFPQLQQLEHLEQLEQLQQSMLLPLVLYQQLRMSFMLIKGNQLPANQDCAVWIVSWPVLMSCLLIWSMWCIILAHKNSNIDVFHVLLSLSLMKLMIREAWFNLEWNLQLRWEFSVFYHFVFISFTGWLISLLNKNILMYQRSKIWNLNLKSSFTFGIESN